MAKRLSKGSTDSAGTENKKLKTEACTSRKCINYMSIPSLKKIAALSVVTSIWRDPDFVTGIHQSNSIANGSDERENNYEYILTEATKRVSELPLPSKLQKYVSKNVKAIGLQIVKRLSNEDGSDDSDDCIDDMSQMGWTAIGTINERKEYKYWIENIDYTGLDNKKYKDIYREACRNCIQPEVSHIWREMPTDVKHYFLYGYDYNTYEKHLIAYWTFFLTNRIMSLNSVLKANDVNNIYDLGCGVYINIISLLIKLGSSLSLFSYFWSELSIGEIDDNITKWSLLSVRFRCAFSCSSHKYIAYFSEYQSYDKRTDIICFLLSQFTDVKKLELVFRENCTIILQVLFMNWPWQDFLLPTVRSFMHCFDKKHYTEFMGTVVKYLVRDKNAEGVLKELWDISSSEIRKSVIIKCFIEEDYLLVVHGPVHLFYIENIDFFNAIIDEADAKERGKIIFDAERSDTLYWLCYKDRLYMLDIVFQRLSLSESQIRIHKKDIGMNKIRDLLHNGILVSPHLKAGFTDWEVVEKLLYYCFSTRQQMCDFKQSIDANEVVQKMIVHSHYSLLEKFAVWFFKDKQELTVLRVNFLNEKGRCLLLNACRKGDWLKFEKFIAWCSESGMKLDEFKDSIVKDQALITELLWNGPRSELQGIFVDHLLLMCLETRENAIRYKRNFLTSNSSLELFDMLVRRLRVDIVRKLIMWYKPLTKLNVERFKDKFKCREADLAKFISFRNAETLISKFLNDVIGPMTPSCNFHPVGINQRRYPHKKYKFEKYTIF